MKKSSNKIGRFIGGCLALIVVAIGGLIFFGGFALINSQLAHIILFLVRL